MIEIKAPNEMGEGSKSIFLAGSIEMGNAEKWQDKVVSLMRDTNWTILNPRRDDWDSSWSQSINNKRFVEQVEWELAGLEKANIILMYFDKNTESPITLLELGLHARSHKLIVVCPEGFWRKGNVDVVCNMYNILQVSTLEEVVNNLKCEEFICPCPIEIKL